VKGVAIRRGGDQPVTLDEPCEFVCPETWGDNSAVTGCLGSTPDQLTVYQRRRFALMHPLDSAGSRAGDSTNSAQGERALCAPSGVVGEACDPDELDVVCVDFVAGHLDEDLPRRHERCPVASNPSDLSLHVFIVDSE